MNGNFMGKHKRKHQKQQNDFTFLEKSSSEPDLSDYSPSFSNKCRNLPYECITVDELKFFRRRKSSDFHTKSNFSLYDESEPIVPFSKLKTEYVREFSHVELMQRPSLRRRATSLKLDGLFEVTSSEHQSMYRPYLEEETASCRQSLAKIPDNLFVSHATSSIPDETENFKEIPKNDAQHCHLKLEGELSYVPEYRSQFIPFSIERSHSIPQLSNIKFHGKFGGVAEYTDSYKSYENIAKREMIRNPDLINVKGTIDGVAEYKDNYKEPDKSQVEKSISAKSNDEFHLQGDNSQHVPEYNERFKNPKITAMPERPKPNKSILALQGQMEYKPEYRSRYLDFPRSRPIIKKPPVNLNIFDAAYRNIPPRKNSFQSPNPARNIHLPDDFNPNLPFECQPEVRKAKNDLLIKERNPMKHFISSPPTQPINLPPVSTSPQQIQQIDKEVVGLPSDEFTNKSSSDLIEPSGKISPSFKLTVQNVDDTGGSFRKTVPKYGRRASTLGTDAHRLRNRTRIIEGNRNYFGITESKERKKNSSDNGPSFIVLNEPCKQSKWMKPTWYDP